MATDANEPVERVLARWGLADATVAPIEIGLINRTFRVERGAERWILQRLHPAFAATVHADIDAITRRVESRGVPTPRLVPADGGALWVEDEGVWRVLTFLHGRVVTRVSDPSIARAAAQLIGRFHTALADFTHAFHFKRAGVHDRVAHRTKLLDALSSHRTHALYDRVAPFAEKLLDATDHTPSFATLPQRIVHGDLKISNVLFDDALGEARALLDLDTLAHFPLAYEMGDAMRSWCNPVGEDATQAQFDVGIFAAAMTGYAERAPSLDAAEIESLVPGTHAIAVELATRFCTDALVENYFGWNAARYATRGEHNLVRALGQWSLAEEIARRRTELERVVRTAFGR